MAQRLLVVEDESGIRVPLADSLRVAGYDVETVEDGESALQAAPGGGFDLILLDLLLPEPKAQPATTQPHPGPDADTSAGHDDPPWG